MNSANPPVRELVLTDPLFVHVWPGPVLSQQAGPIGEVTDDIRRLLDLMAKLVEKTDALGVAAPQLGVGARLIVVRGPPPLGLSGPEHGSLIHLVNPEIVNASQMKRLAYEGCLSFPGERQIAVERSVHVTVKALDQSGAEVQLAAEGLFAVILQHEIDHLDGITLADHVSGVRKSIMRERLSKVRRRYARDAARGIGEKL